MRSLADYALTRQAENEKHGAFEMTYIKRMNYVENAYTAYCARIAKVMREAKYADKAELEVDLEIYDDSCPDGVMRPRFSIEVDTRTLHEKGLQAAFDSATADIWWSRAKENAIASTMWRSATIWRDGEKHCYKVA